jgi:GDP-L-fucose synthase
MNNDAKIYVAGHSGMVGSAVVRCLNSQGFENLVLRTSRELDLTRQADVERFFEAERPEYVFLAAARVGGILANNTYRAEFIYTNLQIQNNVLHTAWKANVKKLLFFSSSCVYPRMCPQPMKEEYLMTGSLENSNEPYAMAKLSGMSMCQAYNEQYKSKFISVIPTNLYGPNDNYDPEQSHLIAALIQKFHTAKMKNEPQVTIWGSGLPRREIMHVDDAAAASIFLMDNFEGNEPVNIGWGKDLKIIEIANIISTVVEYQGELCFDRNMPDGTPRKLLDMSKLNGLGWKAKIPLKQGIGKAYQWYLQHVASI